MTNLIANYKLEHNVVQQSTSNSPENKYWLHQNTVGAKIQQAPHKRRKAKIIGASVATTTLLSAGILFYLSRGGSSKAITKNLEKLKIYFAKKIQLDKIENPTHSSTGSSIYLYLTNLLSLFDSNSKFVNNYTSIKDELFKRLMNFKPFNLNKSFGKLHTKITRLFEKIGRQAVKNSYKNTTGQITEIELQNQELLTKILAHGNKNITINGVTKTTSQWLSELQKRNTSLRLLYNKTFGQNALLNRYLAYKHIVATIPEKFKNLKSILLSEDIYKKFIADSVIAQRKDTVANSVNVTRHLISYSKKDFLNDVDDLILKTLKLVDYKDIEQIKALGELRSSILKYVNSSSNKDELLRKLVYDILNIKENILKTQKPDNVAKIQLLDKLQEMIISAKKGEVENILEIYKALLPEDSYKGVVKTYQQMLKSLDKSIKIETDDFISKLRDLTLGSAPTDILSMIAGVTTLGYELTKADDNNQRMSISLKYGIPALSGIATSLYFNAKLFAGSKALIGGLISMWVMNRIGSYADKIRQKYVAQKPIKNSTAQ